MKTVTVIFIVASMSVGCAQYKWQKHGTTQQEFSRDSYQCEIEAVRIYPTMMVTMKISNGYQMPSSTTCNTTNNIYGNGSMNCTTTPGQYIEPSFSTSDVNALNRKEAHKSCMYSKGYQLVEVK